METRGPQLTQSVFEHDTWHRCWAHGFVQCPFATNNAHKLSFAADEAAITTKTGIVVTAVRSLGSEKWLHLSMQLLRTSVRFDRR